MNTLKNQRVAILEDNPVNRDRWTSLVKMCGGDPLPVGPRAPALADLESFLKREKVGMLMCDNRLFEQGDYAPYYGAQAIADSYRSGRGGVLITAYESDDAEVSIREFRRWIPSLIHATELKRGILESALLQADREAREKVPIRARIPYRTIMTVKNVIQNGPKKIVKVVMSQWRSSEEVGFPLDMLPEGIRSSALPGNMFIAQVNIEAERGEDLFFDQFELPNPDALRKSKTLFGST